MAQPHFITPVNVISYEYDSYEPITKESAKKVIEQDEKIYMSTYIPEYYYFDMQKVHKIRNLVIEFGQYRQCHCPRDGNHCDLNTKQFDTNYVPEILYSTLAFFIGFALGDYLMRKN